MDKTLSKSQAFFGSDNVKAPEPKLGNKPILGDRYKSKEFMDLEWERMFTKVWQVAGLEQQLEQPGDFFTFEFGPESILCAKGEDSKIRCFYNVCQHRGNQFRDPHLSDRFAGGFLFCKQETSRSTVSNAAVSDPI